MRSTVWMSVTLAACNASGTFGNVPEEDTASSSTTPDPTTTTDIDTASSLDTSSTKLTDTGSATTGDTGTPPVICVGGQVGSNFDGWYQQIDAGVPQPIRVFDLNGDGVVCGWVCDNGGQVDLAADTNCQVPLPWLLDLTSVADAYLCWTPPVAGAGDSGSCRVETSSGWMVADWEAI